MTTISAKVILDSITDDGHRLTTMQLRYPRCIHGEFMTHRVFSRNASSSRAIPVSRLIQDVLDDPFVPLVWGKNQKGMQADEECDTLVTMDKNGRPTAMRNEDAWLEAMYRAVDAARAFNDAGYHKQIVNRLLEPFSHISVIMTSTQFSNFFALRKHKDAEPHIQILAAEMWKQYLLSDPVTMDRDHVHAPYVGRPHISDTDSVKASVARCARVSYLTHDGKDPKLEDDLALHDKLVAAVPIHASPAEHQASPDPGKRHPELWGNFQGWIQYRKTLPGECQ